MSLYLLAVVNSAPSASQPPPAAGLQWTDILTALGTVGATVAAVVGLLLNQQSAKRDRLTAAKRLEEERERATKEAEQRFLLSTFGLVTESFANYQTYGEHAALGQLAFRTLRVYLNMLPDDMATLIRHELGIARTEMSEQTLLSFAKEHGWTLNPEDVQSGVVQPPPGLAYRELAENSTRIVLSRSPSRARRRADRYRPENPDL